MTIQPSVLIWTVINFCLLMLILNKLLFKPLLAFMDARKNRIDAAKSELSAAEKAHSDEKARLEEERKKALAEADDLARAEISDERSRIIAETAKAKKEYEAGKREKETQFAHDGEKLELELCSRLDELADAFARRLSD